MIFAPHILQVKVITPMDKDEFGRPIPGTGGEYWQEVCKCRCDDNTTKEFSSDNGSVYRPNYHVVCEKRITVKAGDEVRCMDGDGAGVWLLAFLIVIRKKTSERKYFYGDNNMMPMGIRWNIVV